MRISLIASLLLAACGGGPKVCKNVPDAAFCTYDYATCSCQGEDIGIDPDCSPVPCGANAEFNFKICACQYPDFSVPSDGGT